MVLEIEIEQNALICKSSQILLGGQADPNITKSDTSKIKLIIESGNVFHPNARLVIIPPKTLANNEASDSNALEVKIRIGTNNLFEEESQCIFDLSQFPAKAGESVESVSIVGSYNHFAVGSQVNCQFIGNANIFNPKCDVWVPTVKNGNIFQSCVKVRGKMEEQDITNVYQEKICYLVGEYGEYEDSVGFTNRKHANGVKKNMTEVSLLLNASKNALHKYHRLMPVVKSDQL